jgi:hypothetical protein
MTVDNLAIFIFEKGQNTIISFGSAFVVHRITIAIAGISIIDLDYGKLNGIILPPLPMFYAWIVLLSKGCPQRL